MWAICPICNVRQNFKQSGKMRPRRIGSDVKAFFVCPKCLGLFSIRVSIEEYQAIIMSEMLKSVSAR